MVSGRTSEVYRSCPLWKWPRHIGSQKQYMHLATTVLATTLKQEPLITWPGTREAGRVIEQGMEILDLNHLCREQSCLLNRCWNLTHLHNTWKPNTTWRSQVHTTHAWKWRPCKFESLILVVRGPGMNYLVNSSNHYLITLRINLITLKRQHHFTSLRELELSRRNNVVLFKGTKENMNSLQWSS